MVPDVSGPVIRVTHFPVSVPSNEGVKMGLLAYTLFILFAALFGYLIFVQNPFNPRGGVAFNGWSYLGLVGLIFAFCYVYSLLAGTPAALDDTKSTPFREMETNKWSARLSEDRIHLEDAELDELQSLAEVRLPGKKVKAFKVLAVEFVITGNWFPVKWIPPRFYAVECVVRGNATVEGAAPGAPVTTEKVVIVQTGQADRAGLELFLARFQTHKGSSAQGGKSVNVKELANLPGRLK